MSVVYWHLKDNKYINWKVSQNINYNCNDNLSYLIRKCCSDSTGHCIPNHMGMYYQAIMIDLRHYHMLNNLIK